MRVKHIHIYPEFTICYLNDRVNFVPPFGRNVVVSWTSKDWSGSSLK